MGLFVCKKCGTIENTALGHFWTRRRVEMFAWTPELEPYKGESLCSECMPIDFADGSGKHGTGQWHNKFPKQHWSTKFEKEPEGLLP